MLFEKKLIFFIILHIIIYISAIVQKSKNTLLYIHNIIYVDIILFFKAKEIIY